MTQKPEKPFEISTSSNLDLARSCQTGVNDAGTCRNIDTPLTQPCSADVPSDWQPIETAPKDGTKIDLFYPYPRGRTIDCFWRCDKFTGPDGGWFWMSPTWGTGDEGLLPEDRWNTNHYPNMQPTHWMRPLPLPAPPHPLQMEAGR